MISDYPTTRKPLDPPTPKILEHPTPHEEPKKAEALLATKNDKGRGEITEASSSEAQTVQKKLADRAMPTETSEADHLAQVDRTWHDQLRPRPRLRRVRGCLAEFGQKTWGKLSKFTKAGWAENYPRHN